jgi:hypothetical protein
MKNINWHNHRLFWIIVVPLIYGLLCVFVFSEKTLAYIGISILWLTASIGMGGVGLLIVEKVVPAIFTYIVSTILGKHRKMYGPFSVTTHDFNALNISMYLLGCIELFLGLVLIAGLVVTGASKDIEKIEREHQKQPTVTFIPRSSGVQVDSNKTLQIDTAYANPISVAVGEINCKAVISVK